MTSWRPALRHGPVHVGSADTCCAWAGKSARFLKSKSPRARDTASEPFTRPMATNPPAARMRSDSSSWVGQKKPKKNTTNKQTSRKWSQGTYKHPLPTRPTARVRHTVFGLWSVDAQIAGEPPLAYTSLESPGSGADVGAGSERLWGDATVSALRATHRSLQQPRAWA